MLRSAFMSATAMAVCALGAGAQSFVGADATGGGVETVVVTASPLTDDPAGTAAIAGKVDRQHILQAGGNLAEALAEIPGVTGTGFAPGASRPIVRGFDSNRVRLMEDGIGAFDVSDVGPDHGVPIDPLSAQAIEVVRGAASLRYGSQAIGGVVNTLNNRVPLEMPDGVYGGEIAGAYASNAGLGEISTMADGRAGAFAFHADGFYRNAADYDTPLGKLDNSFSRGTGFSLGSSYFFGEDSHAGAALVQYDAKYGIPGEESYIVMRQTKGLSRASFDIGHGPFQTLNIDFGYANYSHKEIGPEEHEHEHEHEDEDEDEHEEGEVHVHAIFRNKELDFRAEQILSAIGPFSASAIGMQVQNREYSALGEGADYLSPTVTTSVAGFLFTEAPLAQNLSLQLSGRIEHVHITGTPSSDIYTERDFVPLSAAAGLLWQAADGLKIGFTASSAARAPAQTELFARGGHHGPGTFEIGDPALDTERANSLEATLRYNRAGFSFEGSLWSSWFDNYIYGDLTGRSCDDDGDCVAGLDEELKELNYVQGSAHFRGLEAKARYTLFAFPQGALSLTAQGDFVRATLSGGGNVPRIPPYRIGGGMDWNGGGFDIGMLALYAGEQKDVGAFDTTTADYIDLRAHISWRPDLVEGLEISLVGRNLTDDIQRNATALNKDEVPLPGRDIRLVLRQAL